MHAYMCTHICIHIYPHTYKHTQRKHQCPIFPWDHPLQIKTKCCHTPFGAVIALIIKFWSHLGFVFLCSHRGCSLSVCYLSSPEPHFREKGQEVRCECGALPSSHIQKSRQSCCCVCVGEGSSTWTSRSEVKGMRGGGAYFLCAHEHVSMCDTHVLNKESWK